jgi:hypothetical protein|tara:strand:+ start:711 stop:1043 length:333 start_codon:yes stop_codon:yes gene_type:complete
MFDAVQAIMEMDETHIKYIIHILMYPSLFNKHTSPFLAKHFTDLSNNEDYKKKCDEYKNDESSLAEYQLIPLLRSRLFSSLDDKLVGTGGGRWRNQLKTIIQSYEEEKYK